jgi:hypothetical protein
MDGETNTSNPPAEAGGSSSPAAPSPKTANADLTKAQLLQRLAALEAVNAQLASDADALRKAAKGPWNDAELKEIAAKIRAGLSRDQAEEVMVRQREWDLSDLHPANIAKAAEKAKAEAAAKK